MGNVTRFKRIYIEITSSCNLNCSFCQETLREAKFMTVEEFSHVLSEIRPYTNYIYLHVKGEPLLHPRFLDILQLCQNSGITVNLTTNGTLLKNKLPELIQYPVHQINLSMHSADDNDCIDMDTYIHDVFESCENLLEHTKTEISLRLWNTKNDPHIFGQSNYEIRERLHINIQSPFQWPDVNNEYFCDRGFCQGLRTHIAILSNGVVTPCCLDGNGVMELGNIFSTHLDSILSSERCIQFCRGFAAKRAVEPLCQHCSFKERFNHKL
ncbi:MAG: radical SAM/SPASM domain-containing protein [Eubacteriales bacterium]|nr:radical SAM/SPASM domain-containing protein [Eubacteriales bacterium]